MRRVGRVDMTRTISEGFGKGLQSTDDVVIEATQLHARGHDPLRNSRLGETKPRSSGRKSTRVRGLDEGSDAFQMV